MLKQIGVIAGVLVPAIIFFFTDPFEFRHISYEGGDFKSIKLIVRKLEEEIVGLTAKNSQLNEEMSQLSKRFSCPSIDDDDVIPESVKDSTSSRKPNWCGFGYDQLYKDYALESAGARIVDIGDTVEHVLNDSYMSRILYSISSFMCGGCDGARTMIQPGSLPGHCWAFKGSRGNAVIQLIANINVTGVAIEHIPAGIAPTGDISSAPRQFQLEGIDDARSRRGHNFGKFEYNKQGQPIQYFEVVQPSKRYFNFVRIKFISNWGHPEYTCVYRVRVHGDLAPGPTYITKEKKLQMTASSNNAKDNNITT